jgi:hypothetical protein
MAMQMCRCPYCDAVFQVHIDPESRYAHDLPTDEEGLTLWVCMGCRQEGQAPLDVNATRDAGVDTSYRHRHHG